MKVSISIAGRGATFYLAQELEKRGMLERLITSYPRFEAVKYGIPRERVRSLLSTEVARRVLHKLPMRVQDTYAFHYLMHELFDIRAARRITPCDILWSWTSFSLASIARAHAVGALSIVEAGNAPMVYQRKVLKEEYEANNVPHHLYHLPTDLMLERVSAEYAAADYISVPSLYGKRSFMEFGIPESKIVHVPYGVDTRSFHQVPKTDDIFRIVFVGGMCLRKGTHYLLKVFSELNLPKSELLLLGSWNEEMRPFFEKYKGKFRWLGHIPQPELYKQYSQCSVFCLPSLDDGFAAVIPQAMACGLPVVCSTNTGAPDIVEDGKEGFIIPIRDLAALKEKLLYLYEHQDIAREMGQAAKRRMQQGFTWNDYGDRVVGEFERILAESKAQRK